VARLLHRQAVPFDANWRSQRGTPVPSARPSCCGPSAPFIACRGWPEVVRARGSGAGRHAGNAPQKTRGKKKNQKIERKTWHGQNHTSTSTIMELNKRYGWSKFIVVVPSVANPRGCGPGRFSTTAEHFPSGYVSTPKSFLLTSFFFAELERFAADAGGM